jgi:predicted neuraminidase
MSSISDPFIEDLFQPDQYFASCHAAYLTEMPNHELWVTYFGGSAEKAIDVGSYLSIKPISGGSWASPRLFKKVEQKSTGTSHLFIAPDQSEMWRFYNLMNGKGWSTCSIVRERSYDLGTTWSAPDYIRKMWGYCTRGKVLVLDNGDYLFPLHREFFMYQGYVLISTNKGQSWKKYGPIKTPKGALEPSIIQLKDGSLLCALRTKEREIYLSRSTDRGHHWSHSVPIGIPNPDSMVELLLLPDGTIVMAHNNTPKNRSYLGVRFSKDNGYTWSDFKAFTDDKTEYSYPSLLYGSDGNIHLVFTAGRKTIRYVRFSQKWLEQ